MNRRRFLRSLAVGAGAVAAAPVLACVPVQKIAPLTFHPNACSMVAPSLPMRMDVLYGYGCLKPFSAVRIEGA